MSQQNQSEQPQYQQGHQHHRGGHGGHRGGPRGGSRGFYRGRGGHRGDPTVELSIADQEKLNALFGEESDYEQRLEVIRQDKESPLYPAIPFDEMIDHNAILQAIDDAEYYQPSRIQTQAIPILNREKLDLIAQAQSGSGKTVAFVSSMLLHINPEIKKPQAICISNTRELVNSNFDEFEKLNKYTKYAGGKTLDNQEGEAKEVTPDTQLIFGTAGKISKMIKEKKIDVSNVCLFIADEADAILGQQSTQRGACLSLIQKELPKNCQVGFFSATFPNGVIDTIKKIRPNIVTIRIKRSEQFVKTVKHWYTVAQDKAQADQVLIDVIKNAAKGLPTYVFVGKKKDVEPISQLIAAQGITCRAFSSDLQPEERDKTLRAFKAQEFLVLCATDVLARGIDVPNTYLVVNYRIPMRLDRHFNKWLPDCDTYYHRAGRAGRFGRMGLCFSILMHPREENDLKIFCSSNRLNIPLTKVAPADIAASIPREKQEGTEEGEAK